MTAPSLSLEQGAQEDQALNNVDREATPNCGDQTLMNFPQEQDRGTIEPN